MRKLFAILVQMAPNIRMSFKSFTTYHQVIAQRITKLGEFFLCGTSCYYFERLRVTKKVLPNLRILGTIGILLTVSVFLPQQAGAQSPEKISYQAVIRDADNHLVTEQSVGMQISILQGTSDGAAVYVETLTPTTNANGLVSLEIGTGTTSDDFSTIDWANGPYFIKTETDPAGAGNYTITGVSQLLSVPYAMHAKTAQTVTGGITETDPVYESSAASDIVASDIGNWNDSYSWGDHSQAGYVTELDETDPVFSAWDKSTGILITESQISDLGSYIETENDPVFELSVASGITPDDTANWNAASVGSYIETDPVFSAWDKSSGISITESQITDLQSYLTGENDPVFSAWDKSSGIIISESQISDLGSYIETETDPAVAANFDFTGAANGDLLQFDGSKYVKFTPDYISDYTVTETDVTTHQGALQITESQITDLQSYLTAETDPVFSAWDKSTGILITESQISDLGSYIETETDPAVAANFDFTGAASGDLLQFDGSKFIKFTPDYISDYTVTEGDVTAHQGALQITESQITDLQSYLTAETDPVFSAWDKSTGILITESQVSDLGSYIETETDPAVAANFDFTGAANGDLLQFDGSKFVKFTPDYISDYTVTETDVTTHQGALQITESQITDLQSYLTAETDPVFSAWDKSTGILITENQISDLGSYIETETDPVYAAKFDLTNVADGDLLKYNNTTGKFEKFTPDYAAGSHTHTEATTSANGFMSSTDKTKLDGIAEGAEVNVNADWNATTGDAQILNKPVNATTTTDGFMSKEDKAKVDGIPTGTQAGEMQYWNGTEWITVAAGNEGQVLTFTGGVPTWITQLEEGEVENPTTGEIWMDRNLGASQVATSSTDAASYGDLYQWGRGADGHESRTSGTISTLATSDNPGHGDFITAGSSPYDWRNPQNDNLWQGISGTNNPCPSGYRLPTEAEWQAELDSWSSEDSDGAFASPLKLPTAGHRGGGNGSLYNVGSYGYYWSSTLDGTYSRHLYFYNSFARMGIVGRASGYSVRCIKE